MTLDRQACRGGQPPCTGADDDYSAHRWLPMTITRLIDAPRPGGPSLARLSERAPSLLPELEAHPGGAEETAGDEDFWSRVQDAFTDDGTPTDERYHQRATEFLEELEWYAYALREARVRPCSRSECAAATHVASAPQ